MVVTQGREYACRCFEGIKKYIKDKQYTGIKPAVAFSGKVPVDDQVLTEDEINGFSATELPDKFDSDLQLLIVAEKYQAGFDQPKLCAMYVDRKLSGLQAVQTLSRLIAPPRKSYHLYLGFKTPRISGTLFVPSLKQPPLKIRQTPTKFTSLKAGSSLLGSLICVKFSASLRFSMGNTQIRPDW